MGNATASADITRIANALRATASQSDLTVRQVLIGSANQILTEMQIRVPVDTGNLRDSLKIWVQPDRVIIGPDATLAPYAKYVESGTRPHEIKPKTPNGVLAFHVNGQLVITKRVKHPGTKAQPFVLPAFEAWVDSLGRLAAEANIQVFQKEAR